MKMNALRAGRRAHPGNAVIAPRSAGVAHVVSAQDLTQDVLSAGESGDPQKCRVSDASVLSPLEPHLARMAMEFILNTFKTNVQRARARPLPVILPGKKMGP